MAVATSTALAIGAAALAAGGAVYSGEQQRIASKKSLSFQRQEAAAATARALDQKRKEEEKFRRLNQKKPDLSAAMEAAQERLGSPTLLTGPGGTGQNVNNMSRNTLLGM